MKYKGNKNKKEKIHEKFVPQIVEKIRSFLRTRPCIGAKGSYKYIKEIIFGFRSRICLHDIIFKIVSFLYFLLFPVQVPRS
jgi:hypothetical protein